MKVSLVSCTMPVINRSVGFTALNPSNGIAARVAETVKHTPFPTLGDSAERNYPDRVKAEKVEAGLDKLSTLGVDSHRHWYYWGVDSRPLPMEIATRLNEVAGGEIRAFGYAGGMDAETLKQFAHGKGVDGWHVDTKEGLRLLSETLHAFLSGTPIKNILKVLEKNAGKFRSCR